MKQIYRLSRDKRIAGICAGLGDRYSIDPTLVRLALVFLTVLTGIWPGIVTYLVGWAIIPEYEEPPAKPEDSDSSE